MRLDHNLSRAGAAQIALAPLATERLVLRPPRPDDVGAVAALANDIRVAENTARIPYPYLLDDARAWIASTNTTPGDESYLITLTDGALVGACGLHQVREDTPPEIAYWIGVSYWGLGYATEAVNAVIDHAFGELDYDILVAGARVSNPASRRILEKCGFQWTDVGLYRIRSLASSVPVDRFRLERSAWTARQQPT
jgi:RimJ/RimL family protein N-acetyltransferase